MGKRNSGFDWFRFFDSFLEWEYQADPHMVSLLMHMLCLANRNRMKASRPGEFYSSIRMLSLMCGIGRNKVAECIKLFVNSGTLETNCFENNNKNGSRFVILKWSDYQATPKMWLQSEPHIEPHLEPQENILLQTEPHLEPHIEPHPLPYKENIIRDNIESNNTHTIENKREDVRVDDKANALANELWAMYPRKQDMSEAFAEVLHAAEREPDFEKFRQKAIAAVTALRDITNAATDERKRFIPKMSTFFRKGSYMDDPETWRMQFGVFDARHGHGGYDFGKPVEETQNKEKVEDVGEF